MSVCGHVVAIFQEARAVKHNKARAPSSACFLKHAMRFVDLIIGKGLTGICFPKAPL